MPVEEKCKILYQSAVLVSEKELCIIKKPADIINRFKIIVLTVNLIYFIPYFSRILSNVPLSLII